MLVLTGFDLGEYAYNALRAGGSVISPGPTRKLIGAFTTRVPGQGSGQAKRLAELIEREREVLTAVASGWTNGEIGARDRAQAVIFAYDAGPVRPV